MALRSSLRFSGYDARFLLYAFVCFVLMALSVRFPTFNETFSENTIKLTLPFARMSQVPSESLADFKNYIKSISHIYGKNKRLEETVEQLKTKIEDLHRIQYENERLTALLQLVSPLKGDAISAHVMLDPASPFRRTFLVDAGRTDGVEKGQEVLSAEGLVGRIIEVFDTYSRILLISDYMSRVPVKILETRERAILSGTNKNNKFILLFTEKGDFIRPNMTIVTSGDGDVFSEGLIVGYVDDVQDKIYVRSEVDLTRVDRVSILRRKVKGVLSEKIKEEGHAQNKFTH